MNKFKLAMKKIAVVGTATAVASSSVLAAGAYPSMFVEDGTFNGQVVVGASASASDTTAAEALIADLALEFSGNANQVEIVARKSAAGSESVNVVKSNSQLNYGEVLGASDVTEDLDDSDVDFLEDGRFENGVSDEDFTQEITFVDGEFNYALRDNVDNVDDISNNIYFDSGDTYLSYVLEFDSAIAVNGLTQAELDDEFIGEVLAIMGNEFTLASISTTGTQITELELIGGANKIALGESEETTVSIDGKSYTVSVQSVSDDEVLLTVNGQSKSIDEFDTEEIAGISVAVTELVDSDRDSVKGYAEIVVGGQKVTLEDSGEVQVNEEDVSEEFDGYLVESTIADGGFNTITITYKVDDDVSLEAGDSLIDPLFGGFELVFEGTNNPDYSEIEFRVNDDDISVDGMLESGDDFNRDLIHTTSTNGTNGATYLKGDQDEDIIFTSASDFSAGALLALLPTGVTMDGTDITFDTAQTAIKGSGFLLYDDEESQYLYEISTVDTTDNEVDLDELFEGKDQDELSPAEVLTDLELTLTDGTTGTDATLIDFTAASLNQAVIAFENELLMDLSAVETDGVVGSTITLTLDTGDVKGDDEVNDEDESIDITLAWDVSDEELDLAVSSTDFENSGDADVEDGNSDVQQFVTVYGTLVEVDNDEDTYVKVMVPEEQVAAEIKLVTGGSSSSTVTRTVDASEVESVKEELIDDGYSIISENAVSSEEVEFDVSGVTLDVDADVAAGNHIVIGGPAVNAAARDYLGISSYDISQAGVNSGEGVARVFEDANSVLIYGYSAADTVAIVERVNAGTANFQ